MGGDARYVSDLATGEDLDRLARVYGLVRNRIAVWPALPMRISAERMTEKLAPLETRWETDAEFRERVTAYLRSQRDGQVDAAVLGIDRYTLLTAHVAYSTAVSDLYLAANTRPIDAYPHEKVEWDARLAECHRRVQEAWHALNRLEQSHMDENGRRLLPDVLPRLSIVGSLDLRWDGEWLLVMLEDRFATDRVGLYRAPYTPVYSPGGDPQEWEQRANASRAPEATDFDYLLDEQEPREADDPSEYDADIRVLVNEADPWVLLRSIVAEHTKEHLGVYGTRDGWFRQWADERWVAWGGVVDPEDGRWGVNVYDSTVFEDTPNLYRTDWEEGDEGWPAEPAEGDDDDDEADEG